MDERDARLRAHQQNIDRYEGLLKTRLNDVERHYLERCLSEERFAIRMLDFKAGYDFFPTRSSRIGGP